jgi:hypothetical protein
VVLAQRRQAGESGCGQADSERIDHTLDFYLNLNINHAFCLRRDLDHQRRNYYAYG